MKTYFIYALQSLKDGDFYTGMTNDIKQRLLDHNNGKVRSTRPRRPFMIIYYEASLSKKDAVAREKYLKSGMGKKYIKNRLSNYLNL